MSDDIKGPTVVNFELPPDEMTIAIEQFKRTQNQLAEYQRLNAKLIRAKYLGLIDEGFDHKDALVLCNQL